MTIIQKDQPAINYNIVMNMRCTLCNALLVKEATYTDNEDNNSPSIVQSKIDLHGLKHKDKEGQDYKIRVEFIERFGFRGKIRIGGNGGMK